MQHVMACVGGGKRRGRREGVCEPLGFEEEEEDDDDDDDDDDVDGLLFAHTSQNQGSSPSGTSDHSMPVHCG